MSLTTTRAVLLRAHPFGETSRVLRFLTRDKGILGVMAKGVRKVRSRKGGHLEPFMVVSLQLAKGRSWDIVSQAEAQQAYSKLRENLEMIGYASYAVELVDKFVYDEEENTPVFTLLNQTLTRLNRGDDPLLVMRYFEIRLMDVLGFRPELKQCVVTGVPIQPEDQYFSASQGGVVSPEAGKGLVGAVPVSVAALKYLRHFQRSNYQDAARAVISPEIHRELEILMQHYITYMLERGLNTPSFLRRVRRDAGNDPTPNE